MYRLMNLCDDPWSMEKFSGDGNAVASFLDAKGLDGLELIRWGGHRAENLPRRRVLGRHLSFWPIWLDFWREDGVELHRQFGDEAACREYYGAATKEEFADIYRMELEDAAELGARYVVFHVSHVQLEHSYNHRYTYNDGDVADAFLEFVNAILGGRQYPFAILMENHWFPGLTFLDPAIARRLLDGVQTGNKGFVLDIGHLMNTNPDLESEEQAVAYMLGVLGRLDRDVLAAIRTVHLNSSLTGLYAKAAAAAYDPVPGFSERLLRSMEHVGRVDRHEPFLHPSISRVLDAAQPDFLVYELAADTLAALSAAVDAQNRALGF